VTGRDLVTPDLLYAAKTRTTSSVDHIYNSCIHSFNVSQTVVITQTRQPMSAMLTSSVGEHCDIYDDAKMIISTIGLIAVVPAWAGEP